MSYVIMEDDDVITSSDDVSCSRLTKVTLHRTVTGGGNDGSDLF